MTLPGWDRFGFADGVLFVLFAEKHICLLECLGYFTISLGEGWRRLEWHGNTLKKRCFGFLSRSVTEGSMERMTFSDGSSYQRKILIEFNNKLFGLLSSQIHFFY